MSIVLHSTRKLHQLKKNFPLLRVIPVMYMK